MKEKRLQSVYENILLFQYKHSVSSVVYSQSTTQYCNMFEAQMMASVRVTDEKQIVEIILLVSP
jgi:hypothetical protein